MSKAAKKKSSKKARSGSEVAQFDQKTINEFKEAFGIMDQNKDGIIDKSKAAKKKSSKKARSGSEVAQFDQKTINEFKEAFGIMDQNKDGIIDKKTTELILGWLSELNNGVLQGDLKDLYATMGQIASDKQIEDMIKEAPGPINFTVFLTLFGERLTGAAVRCIAGHPPIENGEVDYKAFAHQITTGAQDELAAANA
ncbi:EF hand [Oesophagostomum dentatum]|uniref:EF hand n=1 Tax=Oesophagostomum dentatum TaxID=61180 RepID=A0A0B1TMV1_OESDE|nr:EF hand [Oesophagostomum dentatum]